MAKSQNFEDVSQNSLIFEVWGPPKTGPKLIQKRVPNRIFDAEALGKPHGGRLDALGSLEAKTLSESLLGRLGALLEPKNPEKNLATMEREASSA